MDRRGFLGLLLKGSVVAVSCATVVGVANLHKRPHDNHLDTWYVHALNDFPDAIDGVIHLKQNTNYKIMGDIDLGSNRLSLTAGSSMDIYQEVPRLIYTGVGPLFNG